MQQRVYIRTRCGGTGSLWRSWQGEQRMGLWNGYSRSTKYTINQRGLPVNPNASCTPLPRARAYSENTKIVADSFSIFLFILLSPFYPAVILFNRRVNWKKFFFSFITSVRWHWLYRTQHIERFECFNLKADQLLAQLYVMFLVFAEHLLTRGVVGAAQTPSSYSESKFLTINI